MAQTHRRTQRLQSAVQQKRHQFLTNSSNEPPPAVPVITTTAPLAVTAAHHDGALPADTLGAIHYLIDLLRPSRVRQQKVFPRVLMVHQLYSIISDHTTVDRTLAQLIKDGTIRKFYLGGTGSDEFAIMLTTDYIDQIQKAKEQYLKDLLEVESSPSMGGCTTKRKLGVLPPDPMVTNKKIALEHSNPGVTARNTTPGLQLHSVSAAAANRAQGRETIFDRFKDLVMSGNFMEISIQHGNIQSVMGATDQDITTLIRYSLLNRSLSIPANPHLVNLTQPSGRGTGGSGSQQVTSGSTSGGHSALNQLIHATNQEQAKMVKSDSTGSSPASAVVPTPNATTITASLARRERVSDDVAYRYSIRQGGLFVTHFLKGRLEILRMIRRQTFGDLLISTLLSKPLRGSFLPHEFHIHDIVGSGRVQRNLTTSGQLLKLTQKGETSAKSK